LTPLLIRIYTFFEAELISLEKIKKYILEFLWYICIFIRF